MRIALIVLLAFILEVFAKDQTPPVPNFDHIQKKRQALRDCRVPPQIAILPPQIDKDYRECVNNYYIPNINVAETSLKKMGFLQEEDKLLSIKKAADFIRVFEFHYETKESKGIFSFGEKKVVKKTLLCDDSIKNCYRAQKLLAKKKETKDTK